jgi:hypothetical protein
VLKNRLVFSVSGVLKIDLFNRIRPGLIPANTNPPRSIRDLSKGVRLWLFGIFSAGPVSEFRTFGLSAA